HRRLHYLGRLGRLVRSRYAACRREVEPQARAAPHRRVSTIRRSAVPVRLAGAVPGPEPLRQTGARLQPAELTREPSQVLRGHLRLAADQRTGREVERHDRLLRLFSEAAARTARLKAWM